MYRIIRYVIQDGKIELLIELLTSLPCMQQSKKETEIKRGDQNRPLVPGSARAKRDEVSPIISASLSAMCQLHYISFCVSPFSLLFQVLSFSSVSHGIRRCFKFFTKVVTIPICRCLEALNHKQIKGRAGSCIWCTPKGGKGFRSFHVLCSSEEKGDVGIGSCKRVHLACTGCGGLSAACDPQQAPCPALTGSDGGVAARRRSSLQAPPPAHSPSSQHTLQQRIWESDYRSLIWLHWEGSRLLIHSNDLSDCLEQWPSPTPTNLMLSFQKCGQCDHIMTLVKTGSLPPPQSLCTDPKNPYGICA